MGPLLSHARVCLSPDGHFASRQAQQRTIGIGVIGSIEVTADSAALFSLGREISSTVSSQQTR